MTDFKEALSRWGTFPVAAVEVFPSGTEEPSHFDSIRATVLIAATFE
jgi:hypothetical protein